MISRLTAYAVTTAVFAAFLSACGGGSNSAAPAYSVSVDVAGLSGSLVVQLTPGDVPLTVTADGATAFSASQPKGTIYGVTITTQPAAQYCSLANNAGTVSADVTVSVTCNTSLGGIWKATVGGTQYLQIADPAGGYYTLVSTASVGFGTAVSELDTGTANVTNNNVTGTYSGVDPSGTFADGSTYGSGTLNGTIAASSTLDLMTQFTTADSNMYSQTLDYAYDTALSETPSSLATISGNYTDEQNDGLSITSGGVLYLQSPGTGCVENGSVTVIDSRYNVYDISFTYGDCAGNYTYLNGVSFSGLMTLDTEFATEQIIGGITGELSDGSNLIVPLLLQRT